MVCSVCTRTTSSRWYKGSICTTCHSRAFRLKNSNYHKEYQRFYLQQDVVKAKRSIENSLNKKRKTRQQVRRKERYHNDVFYKLKVTLRTRLTKAIYNNQKVGSAVKDLGCSIQFLKTYLESKFQPGMTWDNYGNGEGFWNIDHIRPLASFDLSDLYQFKLACNFNNLQPLWWRENIEKSDKYESK